MEGYQQRFTKALDELKQTQRDLQKKVEQRQQLDSQLNENKTVKEELDLIKADTRVFKLIGPALVRQDNGEAKQTVAKRIEYITSELKRVDDMITSLEEKQTGVQDRIAKIKTEVESQQKTAQ